MKIIRIAKHVSSTSHFCVKCKSNLIPRTITKNTRHHFHWGILYRCNCGYSSIWTNSIRGEKEFIDVVYNGKQVQNKSHENGFCNDKFCGECYNHVIPLKNSVYFDSSERPLVFIDRKLYRVPDLVGYIKTQSSGGAFYSTNLEMANGSDIAYSCDVYGCKSLNHNLVIAALWGNEYGESEYSPIYDWIKNNKSQIPSEMIEEFKGH